MPRSPCSLPSPPAGPATLSGAGGFYAIHGDDGVTYDPTNLPQEFQKDGIQVEAEARRRDDMAGIHQVGTIVQLERIRRR